MKRALMFFSAVVMLSALVGCQATGGNSCRKCEKGLLDYEGPCDEHCGRGKRGGHGNRRGDDGCDNCDDGSCGRCKRGGHGNRRGDDGNGSCDDGSCGRCGLCARMRGRLGGHGAGAADMGPPGPMTPQYTYPYYTTRGPRDFLLDNPPTIGY